MELIRGLLARLIGFLAPSSTPGWREVGGLLLLMPLECPVQVFLLVSLYEDRLPQV